MVSLKITHITATTVVIDGKPTHTVFALCEDGVIRFTEEITGKSTRWQELPKPVTGTHGNIDK